MSWAVGYSFTWDRDIGYGVPATCDQPGCGARIDRGLGYVCGADVHGGDQGCGLFFCSSHQVDSHQRCDRCAADAPLHKPTPDVPEWLEHKLRDASWARWREAEPAGAAAARAALAAAPGARGAGS